MLDGTRFWIVLPVLAPAVCFLPVGCGPSAEEGGFHSSSPAAKLHAIHQAGRDGDQQAVPLLIEQLNSDDPAVRMYAINALNRVTGRRLQYNPYGTHAERAEGIRRWVEAYESGELNAPAASQATEK